MSDYKWFRVTYDMILSSTQTRIDNIIITGKAQSAPTITLYDGESANDPEVITLKTWSGLSKQFTFDKPLYTSRGLFIEIDDNTEEVFILIDWQRP